MKILSPRVHGYLDYLVVALLFLAPTLFGFGGIAASICYVLAPIQLVMSLLTAYPLGVAKVIPFPVHGGIELVTSIGLLAAPWLFGFSALDNARNFFIVAAVGLGLVWATTNYVSARTTTTNRIGIGL
ncbi:SPW repeat domain-containing protein [Polyangium aurulentum]|uniref:SPW repeat domain-containing protein n=1 Tax=Polyangium aurulentum TaxID=2567896 RepID=UPI0010AED5DD|nr:hypothetical protein [Polyangium aurulentum]UQA57161.1 hypothetical protein E8A73_038615 [Polyangium aurulentum]